MIGASSLRWRLVLALAAFCTLTAPAGADRGRAVNPVPADYFGIHCNACSSPTIWGGTTTPFDTFKTLNQKAVRLWDSGVTWRAVEPTRGTFAWARLDQEVAQNEAAGFETFLTLGQTPDYCATAAGSDPQYNPNPPADTADGDACWREYVTAVVARYGNRIRYYGLWNEPDAGSWNGGLAQLLRLASIAYPIIKAGAPVSLVMSPEFSPMPLYAQFRVNLVDWLAGGGGAYMDAAAIHFYPGDGIRPEIALGYVEEVRATLDRYGLTAMSIYDSEDGTRGWRDRSNALHDTGPFIAGYKDWLPASASVGGQAINMQAAYVTRQYLVTLGTGLVRQHYYYTYDNPDGTGGTGSVMAIGMVAYPSTPATLLPPALAYRYLAGLLAAGWVSNWQRVNRHWELGFATAAGQRGRVYWCDDYATDTATDTAALSATDNLGNAVTVPLSHVIPITGSPIFVFYS